MENSILQLKTISDSWISPSFVYMATDIIIGVMCGVGLFLLLIPFLKTHQQSPPPGSDTNTPKVANRGQSKTREKMTHGKGCRHARKKAGDTQKASRPVEIPTKHPLLDSSQHSFWNSDEKLKQLPLSQLLSYFKVLEDLIQQKFRQIFWGMSSVFSESVVATAWVSRRPPHARTKTVRFTDACSGPALTLDQVPPQSFDAQPLSHHLGTPSLAGVTEVQTMNYLPSSTLNKPSLSQRKTYRTRGPTARMKVPASLTTQNQPWQQQGLKSEDTTGPNVQHHQAAISQPTHNLLRDTQPTEAMRSVAILPEHAQILQYHEEPQNEDRMTRAGEQRGPRFRFLPSEDQMQPPGYFPANGPGQSENRLELSQSTQPSILDFQSFDASQVTGSVPSGMPLKGSPNFDKHYPNKEGLSVGAKDFPCTSSSTLGKGLDPRSPALRTDQQSYVDTTQNISFLDVETQRKLELNVMQLSAKHRRLQYLQSLKSPDLTPPGVPASSLPQSVHPQSATCGSKAEYYSKAAMILEKLHHRDPGGMRVETVSSVRLQSLVSAHPSSEVKKTGGATPPAASHGPSGAYPDVLRTYLNAQTRAFCFQARTQQSRTIQGTGRGSQKPNISLRMTKHRLWERFENEASEYPCKDEKELGPQETIPPSVAKQTHRLEVKEETPPAWKVNLGSREIPNSQAINTNVRGFESVEANRGPGLFQTPALQCLEDLAPKTPVLSETNFRSSKQPQAWPVSQRPPCPSSVHPATVTLPSHSLPSSFENRSPNPKASQGLDDTFTRSNQSVKAQEFVVPKDTVPTKNHKMFHADEERERVTRSRATCQEEGLEGVRPSTPSPTQLKDTAMSASQPSLDKPGKEPTPPESYLKKITQHILQHLNLNATDKGGEDSWKNENTPQANVMIQDPVTREKLIYKMATEVQSLMDVVVQILVNWLGVNVGDPTKAQWCTMESKTFQLSDSSPEGLYDSKKSQSERRMSCGPHTSPRYSHSSIYSGTGDKQHMSVDAHRAWDQPQSRAKKGMGFDQLPTFMGNNHPFVGRVNETKHQSGMAIKTARAPDQIKVKSRVDYSPYSRPKGHKHPFRCREIHNGQQSGTVHRVCDPHQNTQRRMGCGHLTSPKENKHPLMYRGIEDTQQSGLFAQRACDPR